MTEEELIRQSLEDMKEYREGLKAENEKLLPRVLAVMKRRKYQDLETFRAELPVVLSVIGKSVAKKHVKEIVVIARESAKITEQLT